MGLFDKFKKQNEQNDQPQTTLVPNMGRMPFPAYRGNEPYIFISYAHLDYEKVFREIKDFNERGYNVWYDEGISPGNEWTDEIADALERCSLFIVLITPNSAVSPNVLKEVNFAIEDKKPFIAIHLEETILRGGLKLQISTIQAILKYKMTEEEYVYKYTTAFTRLGMEPNEGVQPKSAAPAFSVPAAAAQPSAAREREIRTVGDFRVEHGLLLEYLGKESHITLPDEVEIIGSSAFQQGRRFIETVDLNKTGALLNGAFTDCPNLRTITIPRSVTMIKEKPFVNCPQLVLYCYRSQLPPEFEENFGGKEIVYLEDSPTGQSAGLSFGEWVGKQREMERKKENDVSARTSAAVSIAEDSVVFASPELHRIVCAELGCSEDTVLTRSQCDSVTSLSVCGNAVGRKFNAYTNDGFNVRIVPTPGSGAQMITVERGSLDSLEDIPLLRNLTKLTVPYQSFFDLTPLANSKIEKLDLSANMLGDLLPLTSMRFLKELNLSHTRLDSVVSLGKFRSLTHLTYPGIYQAQFDEFCEIENESLTCLIVSGSGKLQNIDKIVNLKNLEALYVADTHVTDIEPALSLRFLRRLGIRNLKIADLSVIKQFNNLEALATDKKQEEIIAELYGGKFPYKAY